MGCVLKKAGGITYFHTNKTFLCYLSLTVWCVCVCVCVCFVLLFTPFLSVLSVSHIKNLVL